MSRGKPTILLVVMVHLVVIGLLWILPGILNRMKPVTPPPDALFVSLVSPEPAVQDVAPVEVSAPKPPPEPEAPPEPVKKKKKKIEISKKKIVRDKPQEKKLAPEEIRRKLALNSRPASPNAVKAPLPAWYYASAQEILYGAWSQPASLSAQAGHQVQVQLTVARDGRILASRILRRSGQPDMDSSVQSALSAVSRLKALPTQYSGTDVNITITFELNRG